MNDEQVHFLDTRRTLSRDADFDIIGTENSGHATAVSTGQGDHFCTAFMCGRNSTYNILRIS